MILKNRYFYLNLLCIIVSVKSLKEDSPFVKTPLGGVRGHYKNSAEGRRYAAYESIPYANPPIGEIRFEPPVPVTPWTEDIEAVNLPPLCPQYDPLAKTVEGVEDCLYLNIYIPSTNKTGSLPIIFGIHGGGFTYGTSSDYGPKYLMDRDVIFVTINYRLGPLGFLTTGDETVPGNMGLKDQSLALKWVSENIKHFGGDPKRLTLMGASAGGASVQYHYLSPMSRGLFQNGISFSGSVLNPWAFAPDATQNSKDFAALLNCPTDKSITMVQCLRTVPSYNLTAAVNKLTPFVYFHYAAFPPVPEKINKNYFINDTPTNIIVKGAAYDVPWIVGIVKDDGLIITAEFVLDKNLVEYTDKNWEFIGPYMVEIRYVVSENMYSTIARKSRQHYFGNESFNTDMNSIGKLTHLIGDAQIAVGVIKAAKLQAKYSKSPVRFYYYTYRAAQSYSDYISNSTIDFGVCHYDDIYVVLSGKFMNPTTTAEDRAMQQDMLNFWYSYANTSEPDLGIAWPRLTEPSDKLHYMHIAGPRNFTMESSDNLAEETFWTQIGL